mmetsp:Transcript_21764/g.60461  ORF Transcript_21764/g.60461 Transcript_21764/m.60461 type:complete len:80 (-) Transcript_21764:3829-4068(-)
MEYHDSLQQRLDCEAIRYNSLHYSPAIPLRSFEYAYYSSCQYSCHTPCGNNTRRRKKRKKKHLPTNPRVKKWKRAIRTL